MPADSDLQCHLLNGQGGSHTFSLEAIGQATDELRWISGSVAEMTPFLATFADCPDFVRKALLSKTTRPRAERLGDGLLVTLREIESTSIDHLERSAPSIRLWITPKLIITTYRRRPQTLLKLQSRLKQNAGPRESADFLLHLLQTLSDNSSDAVLKLDDKLTLLETKLTLSTAEASRVKLNHLRKTLLFFRRHFVPQREAINRIILQKPDWISDAILLQLHDCFDTDTRVVETLTLLREQSDMLFEEIQALSQDVLNRRMYLLSIVTLIFLPLGFITGLLGSNVGGIPGGHSERGFVILCALLLFVFGLQIYLLKRKRWL